MVGEGLLFLLTLDPLCMFVCIYVLPPPPRGRGVAGGIAGAIGTLNLLIGALFWEYALAEKKNALDFVSENKRGRSFLTYGSW